MDVQAVQTMRAELEKEIWQLIVDFRNRTGVFPFVDVDWSNIQRIDYQTVSYGPVTVTVSLRL